MMSANLDLVRSIAADWERGDFSSTEWAHPEIEYVNADGPAPSSRTGLDAMGDGFRTFLGAWQGYRFEADEYRELDHECILALGRQSGRGKTSGLELEQMGAKGTALFHIRDGKVTKHVIYWDRKR